MCATLVALVAASISFSASEARYVAFWFCLVCRPIRYEGLKTRTRPSKVVSAMSGARRAWRCRTPEFPMAKSVPSCLYETKVGDIEIKQLVQQFHGLLFDETNGPVIQGIIQDIVNQIKPGMIINWLKVNEAITRILRVWCSDVDRLGGASERFEFDHNVTPICHVRRATLLEDSTDECFTWKNSVRACTVQYWYWCAQTLLYVVELSLASLQLGVKLLVRGPWGEKGSNNDQQRNPDCYSMCKLFRDNGTVSISGLRARASYLGCWLKESQNGEEIRSVMEANVLDCEGWSARPAP